jgi:hypothetical protein
VSASFSGVEASGDAWADTAALAPTFEAMGDWLYVQTLFAHVAHALCAQGRHDEAAAALDRYEDPRGGRGVFAQSARARVLAAGGEVEAALALAREAVAEAADLDWPEGRAQA